MMDRLARLALQRRLTRLADGDRSVFPEVFSALWPLLRGFAGRVLRDAADAEDAAQSALLKIFAHASRFDGRGDALSWVLAIAANECRALRRGRRSGGREPESVLRGMAGACPDPEEQALAQSMEAELRQALSELRPEDRETLEAVLDGRRPRAAIDPATFRKRVQRAILRLRAAWRSRHGAL